MIETTEIRAIVAALRASGRWSRATPITHFPFYFGNFDLLVTLTGQDTGIDPAAAKWERLHNEDQLALMSRFTDGRTYGASSENTYYGREHRIGSMAGQAYLTLLLARNTTGNRLRWR
ncbi:hypothetical protein [Streptomyces sp. NPDC057582]|uniref:hypothetical protein n=1 Tax=Streptomyces sp. NPDC057582 TaxID=3346174 RepID=UPI00368E8FF2